MRDCDICVIGAGPGGYVAAIRAAQMGAKVVVVEKQELGGVCLNWGCIPTKTLIHTAEVYRKLQHAADIGLDVNGFKLNLQNLRNHKDDVVKFNKGGIKNLFRAHNIDLVQGEGQVTGPGRVQAGDEEIQAAAIIIATGSSPAELPGLELDRELVISSTDALELEKLPRRITVIGAGAIGAEFASLWNIFGAEVTMVEIMPQVLPVEDEEIAKKLAGVFRQRGMDVRTGTKVIELNRKKKGATLKLEGDKPGTVEADLVLLAVGRQFHSSVVTATPSLGVEVGKRGEILVDERLETSVPGIYAIGDVTSKTLLAHGASAEALVAVENAMGVNKKMSYRVVPACTFTSPEVASVGMTEKQAQDAGHEVKVGRFQYLASGRAQTMNENEGMVKIVGDARTDEIVGVHIMGVEAGELIAVAALAMQLEARVADIAHTVHTHPTLAETLMEAAEDYYGRSIHTPPRKKRA